MIRKLLLAAIVLSIVVSVYRLTRAPTEQWVDQAAGHDGKVWLVRRTVEFTFGGGELSSALKRWPNKFSLAFDDPSSGREITWAGEKYVNPVLFDVVNGSPWLVVNGGNVHADVERYGCPELPYVFLRYDVGSKAWKPVAPIEAPPVLRRANLSYAWEAYLMERQRTQAPDDIAKLLGSAEVSTSRFFTREIPRTFADWKYGHKKQYATSRRVKGDCRAPLSQPVDAIFPRGATLPSTPVTLEVVEEQRHSPKSILKGDPNSGGNEAWSRLSWDKARYDGCNAHVRAADAEDQRLVSWQAFIAQPSRMFAPGHVICDADALWFYSYVAERGRVVVVKANPRGDILYRVSFPKPDEPEGAQGAIMNPTLRAADGYLNFEWWNANHSGHDVHVIRAMKVRFREPTSGTPAS